MKKGQNSLAKNIERYKQELEELNVQLAEAEKLITEGGTDVRGNFAKDIY